MEGTLFIVGGGLIQSADEVFAELIRRAGGANGRFAFIVSASGMDPDDTFCSYRDDFVRLGAREENCVLVPLYAPHVRDERGYNAGYSFLRRMFAMGQVQGILATVDRELGIEYSQPGFFE